MASEEKSGDPAERRAMRPDTVVTHAGLDPRAFHGFVNPPVVRASTIIFESAEALLAQDKLRYPYGLYNTPTIEALVDALTVLEGAAGTVLLPSGLSAVTTAILVAIRPGMRLLMADNAYTPTRRFCDQILPQFGVETIYYDPLIGAGIRDLLNGACAVFIEAPGSHTFEMPDIPMLVAAAKAAGVMTMMDNTWATPLVFRPLEHGIDLAIYAGSKYAAGHSDLLIGSISANESSWPALKRMHRRLGIQAGTEEIWLTLRGLRTMSVRLERHERSALEIARWLQRRPEVVRVLHPALPDNPGHTIWKRDFKRSNGLFGFVLNGKQSDALTFLNSLKLFAIGESWGGFESLAVPSDLAASRTARPWTEGPAIRLHVGLEDIRDLIADLEGGFAAIAKA